MSDEQTMKGTKFITNFLFWLSMGFAFIYLTIQVFTYNV